MQRHLPKLVLAATAAAALLALGGCAIQPAYRYNANGGAGYYSGQSSYGNADTVIYGAGVVNPWAWRGGWAPGWRGWGYGAGWWGYDRIGVGINLRFHPHRHWRGQRWHGYRRSAAPRRHVSPHARQPNGPHAHRAPVHSRAPSNHRTHETH